MRILNRVFGNREDAKAYQVVDPLIRTVHVPHDGKAESVKEFSNLKEVQIALEKAVTRWRW